jgi:hypothetical protein
VIGSASVCLRKRDYSLLLPKHHHTWSEHDSTFLAVIAISLLVCCAWGLILFAARRSIYHTFEVVRQGFGYELLVRFSSGFRELLVEFAGEV